VSGELIVDVARELVGKGVQAEAARQLPGGHGPSVGRGAAAEEEVLANAPPTIPGPRSVPPLALMASGRFGSTVIE
jgi:hypothetical protein